jgi:3-hydroxymyristoyl/3-hydroxydecanoyl-(acyl carrier protein) dehydratase
MQPSELEDRVRKARRGLLFPLEALPPSPPFGRAEIEHILPHRGSMLLLDEIIGVDAVRGRLVARRRVDRADPVFEGHFPGAPVYPGVLQVEMSGQLGLCIKHFLDQGRPQVPLGARPRPVRLVRVRDASFVAEARPGDELTILTKVLEDNDYTFTALGQVTRGGAILSASVFEAVLGDDDER